MALLAAGEDVVGVGLLLDELGLGSLDSLLLRRRDVEALHDLVGAIARAGNWEREDCDGATRPAGKEGAI